MYDPTVFDNLKVAFENQVYDMDNLTGKIHITNRLDRLEMSLMSREFALQFSLNQEKDITAELRLEASLTDLAAEILEMPGETPGCVLSVRFMMHVTDVPAQCKHIEEVLQEIWGPELPPAQTLSFHFGQDPAVYINTIELKFKRKINEEQMEDIPGFLQHVLRSLSSLGKV